MKLSAVIITYNEEKNIGNCLKSLAPVADEIIVLDSYSSDATRTIAEEAGASVYVQQFLGYGAQKNKALEFASNDLILSLDADEMLDQPLRDAILQLKKEGKPVACRLSRITNYCGKFIRHGSWYPDRKIRIFRKSTARWNNNTIHEFIELTEPQPVKELKGKILHYSYDSIESHVRQNNAFSTSSAEAMYACGKRAGIVHLVFSPLIAFFKGYFLRLGFLDGFYGFVVAIQVAHLTFLKYSKLYLKQRADVAAR